MLRRPPRSTRTDALFPDTTLFRSCCAACRSPAKEIAKDSFPFSYPGSCLSPARLADEYRKDRTHAACWQHDSARTSFQHFFYGTVSKRGQTAEPCQGDQARQCYSFHPRRDTLYELYNGPCFHGDFRPVSGKK